MVLVCCFSSLVFLIVCASRLVRFPFSVMCSSFLSWSVLLFVLVFMSLSSFLCYIFFVVTLLHLCQHDGDVANDAERIGRFVSLSADSGSQKLFATPSSRSIATNSPDAASGGRRRASDPSRFIRCFPAQHLLLHPVLVLLQFHPHADQLVPGLSHGTGSRWTSPVISVGRGPLTSLSPVGSRSQHSHSHDTEQKDPKW